ncbi:hypothetical protein [Mycobacterium tuberculosis]
MGGAAAGGGRNHHDPVDNDHTVGLLLLVATALVACTCALHARGAGE